MNERSGRAMSREEIRKILGNGIDELHIEMLETLGTTGIDVAHLRPLLTGRVNLMKGERNKLRKAHYASGGRRLFTGHQMAGHLRTVHKAGLPGRFYFAPTGGETWVEIVTARGTFEGFAKCSEEDLFCRATGRRLAFTRALLNAWAPIRPKPQLESGGEVPQDYLLKDTPRAIGKSMTSEDALKLIAESTGARYGGINWPVAIGLAFGHTMENYDERQRVLEAVGLLLDLPFGEMLTIEEARKRKRGCSIRSKVPQGSLLTDALAAALDPSLRLKARSLSKLHKAENLDKALIAGVDEEERPRLEDRARVLREQAIADAAVASRLAPQRLLLDLRDQLEEKIKECHKWAESLQRDNDDSDGAEQFLIEANALENVVSLLPPKAEQSGQ